MYFLSWSYMLRYLIFFFVNIYLFIFRCGICTLFLTIRDSHGLGRERNRPLSDSTLTSHSRLYQLIAPTRLIVVTRTGRSLARLFTRPPFDEPYARWFVLELSFVLFYFKASQYRTNMFGIELNRIEWVASVDITIFTFKFFRVWGDWDWD